MPLPRSRPATIRTDEDTIELLRRLAAHYPDTVIAGILNRQGRTTARGLSFTANRVSSLRTHWKIPCFEAADHNRDGDCMTIESARPKLSGLHHRPCIAGSTMASLLASRSLPLHRGGSE